MRNVLGTWHAWERDVVILVQVLADFMQIVQLLNTYLYVFVIMDIRAIHFRDVLLFLVSLTLMYLNRFIIISQILS